MLFATDIASRLLLPSLVSAAASEAGREWSRLLPSTFLTLQNDAFVASIGRDFFDRISSGRGGSPAPQSSLFASQSPSCTLAGGLVSAPPGFSCSPSGKSGRASPKIVLQRRVNVEEVAGFFSHYPWMHEAKIRRETLDWRTRSYEEKRKMLFDWLSAVQQYDPKVFDIVMKKGDPHYRSVTLLAFIEARLPYHLCDLIDRMEEILFRVYFGLEVGSRKWPWEPYQYLSKREMGGVWDTINERLKCHYRSETGHAYYVALLMAAALFPDRFLYLSHVPTRRSSTADDGFSVRLRGFAEGNEYRTWLVFEAKGGEMVPVHHADDETFRPWVRDLVRLAADRVTPDDGGHPVLVVLMDPSKRQKKIFLEELLSVRRDGGLGDFCFRGPLIRLRIFEREKPARGTDRPRRVVIRDGRRYVVVEETYAVTKERSISSPDRVF